MNMIERNRGMLNKEGFLNPENTFFGEPKIELQESPKLIEKNGLEAADLEAISNIRQEIEDLNDARNIEYVSDDKKKENKSIVQKSLSNTEKIKLALLNPSQESVIRNGAVSVLAFGSFFLAGGAPSLMIAGGSGLYAIAQWVKKERSTRKIGKIMTVSRVFDRSVEHKKVRGEIHFSSAEGLKRLRNSKREEKRFVFLEMITESLEQLHQQIDEHPEKFNEEEFFGQTNVFGPEELAAIGVEAVPAKENIAKKMLREVAMRVLKMKTKGVRALFQKSSRYSTQRIGFSKKDIPMIAKRAREYLEKTKTERLGT
jgi:hypothetical protein